MAWVPLVHAAWPHFPIERILPEQMNAEAHVRKLEDSLAEANAKVAELERNQAEINAIRTRLQGEFSPHCSFLRKSARSGRGICKQTERIPRSSSPGFLGFGKFTSSVMRGGDFILPSECPKSQFDRVKWRTKAVLPSRGR